MKATDLMGYLIMVIVVIVGMVVYDRWIKAAV